MHKQPEIVLAPYYLNQIIDYLNQQETDVRLAHAKEIIDSVSISVDMLESFRRIELNCSNPDFEYIQQMNELLDILSP